MQIIPKSIPEDDLALNEPVEDKSSDPDDTEDHSLENVADIHRSYFFTE